MRFANPSDGVLVSLLSAISDSYDPLHPQQHDQPAQVLLRRSPEILESSLPIGYLVKGSGQINFRLPDVPWIGVMNRDESRSFKTGIYLAYLFQPRERVIYLSLLQGAEHTKNIFGSLASTIENLRQQAKAIRKLLTKEEKQGLLEEIALHSDLERPRLYEAANILAISYSTDAMPEDSNLRAELSRMLAIYESVLGIRDAISTNQSIDTHVLPRNPSISRTAVMRGFNPKSDAEYHVEIAGRTIKKSRTHETLVNTLCERAAKNDMSPATPHPIDLTLEHKGEKWIIEVKVVYGDNYADAVRASVGQLFEYKHFYGEMLGFERARMGAAFNKPLNNGYLGLLRSLDIDVVWLEGAKWRVSTKSHCSLSRLAG